MSAARRWRLNATSSARRGRGHSSSRRFRPPWSSVYRAKPYIGETRNPQLGYWNAPAPGRRRPMLWTIFVILLVLWLLGLVSSYTLGGFIHIDRKSTRLNSSHLGISY